ncbi:Thioredoxin Disulfide Isomerase [Fulvivirga imtechensis AK7]|uniref:Thioredoxin Disulfide Isomerase n=1 Tax=Fulvivirga imtechensis AK7 TaxID=1237149 RepID=L8JW41_9BACT|nr:thioredoxin family protein [Fulvivirga imtechensis]ELR73020.1 Thioredoxin Disulfide Isomerase [Fulvivirga imtechensis AK7]
MRRIVVGTVLVCLTMAANAQEWFTNYDEAKKVAAEKERNIVIVFQGSDWCAPCIKLDREVWSTDEFRDFARDHFVMLQADFPRKKQNALPIEQQEHNKKLAERYNRNGYFPFVVVLTEEGEVLGETGYQKMTPQEYIELLRSFEKVNP